MLENAHAKIGAIFPKQEKFQRQKLQRAPAEYTCLFCTKSFDQSLKERHSQTPHFQCSKCREVYEADEIKLHERDCEG